MHYQLISATDENKKWRNEALMIKGKPRGRNRSWFLLCYLTVLQPFTWRNRV